jgi:glycine/D-amino acid oxidase-like deaminating enzyme
MKADAAIIGAGIIGCSVARLVAFEGAREFILETAADVLRGRAGILKINQRG